MKGTKRKHRLLSILLSLMLVVGLMPAMSTTVFAASEINTLGVTGLSPIFDGKSASDSIHQSAYTAGADYRNYSLLGVVWYDNAARQEENEFNGTFQAGKKYYVETWFKASNGYVFADRAKLTPIWYGPDYFKMIDYEVTSQNSRAYMAFEITCIDFVDGLDIWLKGYEPGKKAEDIKVTLNSDPAGSAFLRGSGQYGDSYYIRDTSRNRITGPLEAGETYELIVNYDVADGYEDDGVDPDGLQKEKIMLNGHIKANSLYYVDRQILFELPAPHTYQEHVISKATTSRNGMVRKVCSDCEEDITETIYYPKTIKLQATNYTYNGKVNKPSVSIIDADGKTISSGNYNVSYATGRKSVGKYKVTVTFKGDKYSGSKYTYFYINPKGTSISKATGAKKAFTVKWKKQSAKMATSTITGYQIRYSTSSKMTSAKTKTVKGYKYTSKKITKLKAKKKYYVQVRTYKTVSGKTYYSSWSSIKSVTTK